MLKKKKSLPISPSASILVILSELVRFACSAGWVTVWRGSLSVMWWQEKGP